MSEPQLIGRALTHWSGEGAWNMSVDEAILQSVSARAERGESCQAVLRFYSWNVPTLSLGYFQTYQAAIPRFADAAVVRRSTGGGAIVHDRELTYSLTVATPVGQRGARHDLYQGVHAVIVDVLKQFGVIARPYRLDRQRTFAEDAFLCFQRRTAEDLIVSGYKVVGSAQRRAKRAVLQHGSVLLRASGVAPELPGVTDLTSKPIDRSEFADMMKLRIGQLLGVEYAGSELNEAELAVTRRVQRDKYGSVDWLQRR
ncbi:lipoate--protein ligase family protein [Roseiconus lacunae]|uniref:lipoate--protein ligase family protein n=1 Tax=Roseiconus lacunae TaxID=2605694 RepID=UPI0011F2AE54|nr:biotin/lipoate A/B protein ligase family protein [Roseiconus lacunae]MCD0458347.1 lipoate--protein ligase family protein [Roseiconus lacunae]